MFQVDLLVVFCLFRSTSACILEVLDPVADEVFRKNPFGSFGTDKDLDGRTIRLEVPTGAKD
jgi:hypothetical protein